MFQALHQMVQISALSGTAQTVLETLIDIGHVITVVIVGLLASYILRLFIQKILIREQEKSSERNYLTAASMINSIIKYAVYFIIITQVLMMFGISATSILAVAGIGSIAIGFGAQSIVADLIVGTTIIFENQYKVGDWVEINGLSGEVESIGLRTTRLKALNGSACIIPNSVIRTIINSSQKTVRAQVEIPIAHTENIDRILALLRDEMAKAENMEGLLGIPEVIGITDFGERCLTIRILANTQTGTQWYIERQLRYMIKRRFDQENIAPPYPPNYAAMPFYFDQNTAEK